MRSRLHTHLILAAICVVAFYTRAQGQTISYELPAPVAGNQAFGGSLGLDFNVNTDITITELGVFDAGGDTLGLPITAHIYDRTATGSPVATLNFASGATGTLVGSQRFLPLATPLTLPAGFQGTIVGEGYGGAENNGNSLTAGLNFDGIQTNTGGAAISFVGNARNGTAGLYPTNNDLGGVARYGAGTFTFNPNDGAPVVLQNATASFSQASFPVAGTIDGNANAVAGAGWANNSGGANTAVFETTTDVNASELVFTIVSGGFGQGGHNLGRFRLSATSDDRATFADGAANGGDVTANWTVLDPIIFSSDSLLTTLTEQGDNSILASGVGDEIEVYTITTDAPLGDITGFRLEALTDPSLPGNGPGRAANGNFVVLEFGLRQVAAVPEPSAIAIWSLLGLMALGVYRLHRCKQ